MLAGPLTQPTGSRAPDIEVLLVLPPVLVVVLVAVSLAVVFLSQRGLLPPLDDRIPAATAMSVVAASLSFGAAAVHNALIAEHLAHDPLLGIAFVVMALFQAGWGLLYLALPGAAVAAVGLIANDAMVVFWAWSRWFGLPFGASAGAPVADGFLDSLAAAFEVLLIVLLAMRLAPQLRPILRRPVRFGGLAVVTTFAIVTIAAVTSVAVTGIGAPE